MDTLEQVVDLSPLLPQIQAMGDDAKAPFSVFVVVNPTRGGVGSVRFSDALSRMAVSGEAFQGNVLAFGLTPQEGEAVIRFRGEIETPEIVQVLLRVDDETTLLFETEECRIVPEPKRLSGPLEDFLLTPALYLEHLKRELITSISQGVLQNEFRRRPREFFARLDLDTSEVLLVERCKIDEISPDDRDALIDAVKAMRATLSTRLILRMKRARRSESSDELKEGVGNAGAAMVSSLTQIFRKAFKAAFGSDDDVKLLDLAFEQFASGELRFKLQNGGHAVQPSSAYFFFFFELGAFAVECGVEKRFWEPLMNSLARSQEIYTEAYTADRAAPGLGSFNPCGFKGHVCEERKQELRDAYAELSYRRLCKRVGENAVARLPALLPPDA